MRVGDFIYATFKGHRIVGKIVYGYSPKMHEFTDQVGRTVDRREVIGVVLDQDSDGPIVRMEGDKWAMQSISVEVPAVPRTQPEPLQFPSPPDTGKKRRKRSLSIGQWIRPLRV